METTTKILVGIIGFCIFFMFVVFIVVMSTPVDNTPNVNTLNNEPNEDLVYIGKIQSVMRLIISNNNVDTEVMNNAAYGIISISQCEQSFKESSNMYSTLERTMNQMNIPIKFKSTHTHYTQAIIYMKQATILLSDDCENEHAITLINKATNELILGNNLMPN